MSNQGAVSSSYTYTTTGTCSQCNKALGTCGCPCTACNSNPCTCWSYGTSGNTVYIVCPICGGQSGNCNCSNTGLYQSGSSTITFSNVSPERKYTVFKLPVKGIMPNKVYVSGRLVTVGILGTDVQAAFAGDKMIFSPGELDIVQYNTRLTVSLDYGDYVYHYNIANSWAGVEYEEEGSSTVKAKLVSKVKQR